MNNFYITIGLVSILCFCCYNILKVIIELQNAKQCYKVRFGVRDTFMCIIHNSKKESLPMRKRHTLLMLLFANILTAAIVVCGLNWHNDWKTPIFYILFFYLLEYIFLQMYNEIK